MDTPVLILKDLRAGYGRWTVLHDLSLSVAQGEITSVVGPNSSGKSTLLKTIAGLLPVRHGHIALWGHTLSQLPPREVARKLAFVPQGTAPPIGLTVEELVSKGRFPHRSSFFLLIHQRHHEVVVETLQQTALLPLRNRLVTALSGGECQRVWLAMALAQELVLLLLNEPTTHLDIAQQLDMLGLVVRLNREKNLTVLMALHDLNLATRFSHRVVVLAGGKIAAQGSPQAVFTPDLLSQVFGVTVSITQVPGISAPVLYPLQTERRQSL